ncbi:jacalin-like lectin [Bacteroides sp.]|uniref:jacalin-like lectin n=1 Tax=Bacteroides sp. TaxID=29523 RepID=UPI00261F9E89|nr:jacalin-like lectin [Bacteroides sp.]
MGTENLFDSFKKSELFGSNSCGKQFDDIETCCKKGAIIPTGIIIRKGDIIDNLTFVYQGYNAVHGGMGGTEIKATLSQGDYIVSVKGMVIYYANQYVIRTLTFTTKNGNVISSDPHFSGQYGFEYTAEKGYHICALFGNAGYYLNSIGFYTVKQDFKIPGMQNLHRFGL